MVSILMALLAPKLGIQRINALWVNSFPRLGAARKGGMAQNPAQPWPASVV